MCCCGCLRTVVVVVVVGWLIDVTRESNGDNDNDDVDDDDEDNDGDNNDVDDVGVSCGTREGRIFEEFGLTLRLLKRGACELRLLRRVLMLMRVVWLDVVGAGVSVLADETRGAAKVRGTLMVGVKGGLKTSPHVSCCREY